MPELLTRNGKMKKSSEYIYNFGIPAYQSTTGLKTCPNAGACAIGCYARSGAYLFSNVAKVFEWRLEQTHRADFEYAIQQEINKKKVKFLRIHDSGDFFHLNYLKKWIRIALANPDVTFYAYTKQVEMVKKARENYYWPNNFIIIFSFGGLQDNLIDITRDRHSLVFPSLYAAKKAGYANASENDAVAFQSKNHKIGLVFHHAKNIENTNWGLTLKSVKKRIDNVPQPIQLTMGVKNE
jgi:hypothetical protein